MYILAKAEQKKEKKEKKQVHTDTRQHRTDCTLMKHTYIRHINKFQIHL